MFSRSSIWELSGDWMWTGSRLIEDRYRSARCDRIYIPYPYPVRRSGVSTSKHAHVSPDFASLLWNFVGQPWCGNLSRLNGRQVFEQPRALFVHWRPSHACRLTVEADEWIYFVFYCFAGLDGLRLVVMMIAFVYLVFSVALTRAFFNKL